MRRLHLLWKWQVCVLSSWALHFVQWDAWIWASSARNCITLLANTKLETNGSGIVQKTGVPEFWMEWSSINLQHALCRGRRREVCEPLEYNQDRYIKPSNWVVAARMVRSWNGSMSELLTANFSTVFFQLKKRHFRDCCKCRTSDFSMYCFLSVDLVVAHIAPSNCTAYSLRNGPNLRSPFVATADWIEIEQWLSVRVSMRNCYESSHRQIVSVSSIFA